jgi:hypothetical protein
MPMVHVQDRRAWLTDQRFFDPDREGGGNFFIRLDNPGPSS